MLKLKPMKQLTFILLLFISASAFAESNPVIKDLSKIIEAESIEVYANQSSESLLQSAKYNENERMLEFRSSSKIAYIQIFGEDDKLEFQLTVMSEKVMISKNLFNIGLSKLAFLPVEGTEIEFTEVIVNK